MESLKSVLVPTDFSPTAWQAVMMGIRISLPSKADLHLVHIHPQEDDEFQEEVKDKLQDISTNLSTIYNLHVDSYVLRGDPRSAIQEFASMQAVDLVVMGMNGTSSNEIGSITQMILQQLKCPVLVVPPEQLPELVE